MLFRTFYLWKDSLHTVPSWDRNHTKGHTVTLMTLSHYPLQDGAVRHDLSVSDHVSSSHVSGSPNPPHHLRGQKVERTALRSVLPKRREYQERRTPPTAPAGHLPLTEPDTEPSVLGYTHPVSGPLSFEKEEKPPNGRWTSLCRGQPSRYTPCSLWTHSSPSAPPQSSVRRT